MPYAEVIRLLLFGTQVLMNGKMSYEEYDQTMADLEAFIKQARSNGGLTDSDVQMFMDRRRDAVDRFLSR